MIWSRIASVTNSASSNASTLKPRLVELSEKRYGMSVDPSLTAMVMTLMFLPLAMFAAAVACVRQFGAGSFAQFDAVRLCGSPQVVGVPSVNNRWLAAWPEKGVSPPQRSSRRLRRGGVDWTVMTPMTRSAKAKLYG